MDDKMMMKKILAHKFFQNKIFRLIIVMILIALAVDVAIIIGWYFGMGENRITPANWKPANKEVVGYNPFIINGGYLYYAGSEGNTTNLYRIAIQNMDNNNRKNDLVFRGRDAQGIIALFELKGDLYFKYQSNSSPQAHYDIYKIKDNACEMVISLNCKIDVWGDDLVLVSLADTVGNNLFKYKQGIFAENISSDGYKYADLHVSGDYVYTLAKNEDAANIYNQIYSIYKMNLLTKEQESLGDYQAEHFALDSEKEKIFFSSAKGLFAIDLDGGNPIELLSSPVQDFILKSSVSSWELWDSWDYEAIYYAGEKGRGLNKLDLSTGTKNVVLPNNHTIVNDGSWISKNGYICIKLSNEQIGLMIINESGKKVFSAHNAVSSFTFDGRIVIYENTSGRLFMVDLLQL